MDGRHQMTALQDHPLAEQGHRGGIRFQLSLPLKYHVVGERGWHDGQLDNMSLIDIIFCGEDPVEAGKTVDLRLYLPRASKSQRGGAILSRATVTQSWSINDRPGKAFIAGVLINPRLVRFNPEDGT
jgi:hypothetical protein